jgi:hypothetical protein
MSNYETRERWRIALEWKPDEDRDLELLCPWCAMEDYSCGDPECPAKRRPQ